MGVPSVEVFRRLRTDAGLSDKAPEAVALAVPHTWHGVVLRHGGAIGMYRMRAPDDVPLPGQNS